jgi:F-box interacting protein|uniref:F-box domain-containing protein n=1 Tax=Fagus sylvatica TaxID=28930 RepID=A0A2N9ER57_FAGSY
MGSSGSDLPQDVVEDILSRLPAKSIMRFRCVNKSIWSTLFQNPTFIAKHHSFQSQNNPTFVIKRRDDIIQKALISLHPNLDSDSGVELLNLDGMPFFKGDMKEEEQEQLDILGDRCINGLICLYNYPLRYQQPCDHHFRIVLWNPAIREFKLLPTNPVHCPSPNPHVRHEFNGFGFGYDHKSNDYKVVRIVIFWDFTPYLDWNGNGYYCPPLVEVYTLSTDSWRQIDAVLDASIDDYVRNSQFYLNGAYHWHGYIDEKPSDAIVSFNMTDEVFRIIRVPDLDEKNAICREYSVLNNCIAMIVSDAQDTVTEKIFDIWVMREYGVKESWTKQFVIGPLSGIQFPLGFTMNDELLMVARDGQLVSYNSNAQEIKSLQVRATQAIVYKESLVSVMGGNVIEN